MDSVEQKVREKLSNINALLYEDLDIKTQVRLKEVEMEISERELESQKVVRKINDLKITKSAIANSRHTSFTRKTLYNDQILNQYVDYSISQVNDYLNEGKMAYLKKQNSELKNQYQKVLLHITERNVLELEIKKLREEIDYLLSRNSTLQEKLIEKERKIGILQKNINLNNLTTIKE